METLFLPFHIGHSTAVTAVHTLAARLQLASVTQQGALMTMSETSSLLGVLCQACVEDGTAVTSVAGLFDEQAELAGYLADEALREAALGAMLDYTQRQRRLCAEGVRRNVRLAADSRRAATQPGIGSEHGAAWLGVSRAVMNLSNQWQQLRIMLLDYRRGLHRLQRETNLVLPAYGAEALQPIVRHWTREAQLIAGANQDLPILKRDNA